MSPEPELEISNNAAKHRIETVVDNRLAKIDYYLGEGKIYYTHTYVPPELEGRGIASRMAKFALEYARQERLMVIPDCPFVSAYIKRHPEYQPLVAG